MKTNRTFATKLLANQKARRATPCPQQTRNKERARRVLTRPQAPLPSVALPLSVVAAWLLMLCPSLSHAQGGVPLWTNRYGFSPGPTDFNYGIGSTALAVDGSGNVFVTGGSFNDDTNLSFTTIKYSGAGVPLWTNRYNGPANGGNGSSAIAVDHNGNVFVTGFSCNGTDSTTDDYATIAYSNSGVPLWTNRYDGPAKHSDRAQAIAVDSSGNVFVTGYSATAMSITGLILFYYATVGYSSTGTPLWTNRYDGPGNGSDVATAIALDNCGNVFVTGMSDGTSTEYTTVAYSNEGVPLWTNGYDGPAHSRDSAQAIAVDMEGNVCVTGVSSAANGFPDYATIKYSSTGGPLWTNRYDGPGNYDDEATAIAVDSSGNVFVTGRSFDVDHPYYTTIKYSSSGVRLWTRNYTKPGDGVNIGRGIAVDSSGNVFVTGVSGYQDANQRWLSDFATVAYSSSGLPLWTNRYHGSMDNSAWAVAVDGSGNVFVTGESLDGTGTNYHFVTIKYSSSLSPPRLEFQKLNNQLVLSWTNAGSTLQSAPFVTGPFTNLSAATSPYTNSFTVPRQFFRLAAP